MGRQLAVRVTSSSSSSSGTKPLPPHVGHCRSSSVPFSMTPSPLHSGQVLVFTCAFLWRSRSEWRRGEITGRLRLSDRDFQIALRIVSSIIVDWPGWPPPKIHRRCHRKGTAQIILRFEGCSSFLTRRVRTLALIGFAQAGCVASATRGPGNPPCMIEGRLAPAT